MTEWPVCGEVLGKHAAHVAETHEADGSHRQRAFPFGADGLQMHGARRRPAGTPQ